MAAFIIYTLDARQSIVHFINNLTWSRSPGRYRPGPSELAAISEEIIVEKKKKEDAVSIVVRVE